MLQDVGFNKHNCSIYTYPPEQIVTTWQYFKEGFKVGERCIYITFNDNIEKLTTFVKNSGEEFNEYLNSGKLIILDNNIYLKNGSLDSSSMMQMISDTKNQATIDGYTGLRISGELPSIATKSFDSDLISRYELEIDDYISHSSNVRALCHYDKNKYEHEILARLVNSHKKIVMYGKIYKNKFYRTNTGKLYVNIFDKLIEETDSN